MLKCSLLLLLAAGSMLADDSKAIKTRDGKCQAAVPASWNVGMITSMATSSNPKMNAIVSSPLRSTFDAVKQNAQKLYTNDKVTKDSATEFQMEGKSMSNQPNVYRAIQSGGQVCLIEVIYETGTIDQARSVAVSLKTK